MNWGARAALPLAVAVALPACSNGTDQPTPPPASADEQQAVAKAAEMLDERTSSPEAEPADTSSQDSIE